jgi:hypothetical protein
MDHWSQMVVGRIISRLGVGIDIQLGQSSPQIATAQRHHSRSGYPVIHAAELPVSRGFGYVRFRSGSVVLGALPEQCWPSFVRLG